MPGSLSVDYGTPHTTISTPTLVSFTLKRTFEACDADSPCAHNPGEASGSSPEGWRRSSNHTPSPPTGRSPKRTRGNEATDHLPSPQQRRSLPVTMSAGSIHSPPDLSPVSSNSSGPNVAQPGIYADAALNTVSIFASTPQPIPNPSDSHRSHYTSASRSEQPSTSLPWATPAQSTPITIQRPHTASQPHLISTPSHSTTNRRYDLHTNDEASRRRMFSEAIDEIRRSPPFNPPPPRSAGTTEQTSIMSLPPWATSRAPIRDSPRRHPINATVLVPPSLGPSTSSPSNGSFSPPPNPSRQFMQPVRSLLEEPPLENPPFLDDRPFSSPNISGTSTMPPPRNTTTGPQNPWVSDLDQIRYSQGDFRWSSVPSNSFRLSRISSSSGTGPSAPSTPSLAPAPTLRHAPELPTSHTALAINPVPSWYNTDARFEGVADTNSPRSPPPNLTSIVPSAPSGSSVSAQAFLQRNSTLASTPSILANPRSAEHNSITPIPTITAPPPPDITDSLRSGSPPRIPLPSTSPSFWLQAQEVTARQNFRDNPPTNNGLSLFNQPTDSFPASRQGTFQRSVNHSSPPIPALRPLSPNSNFGPLDTSYEQLSGQEFQSEVDEGPIGHYEIERNMSLDLPLSRLRSPPTQQGPNPPSRINNGLTTALNQPYVEPTGSSPIGLSDREPASQTVGLALNTEMNVSLSAMETEHSSSEDERSRMWLGQGRNHFLGRLGVRSSPGSSALVHPHSATDRSPSQASLAHNHTHRHTHNSDALSDSPRPNSMPQQPLQQHGLFRPESNPAGVYWAESPPESPLLSPLEHISPLQGLPAWVSSDEVAYPLQLAPLHNSPDAHGRTRLLPSWNALSGRRSARHRYEGGEGSSSEPSSVRPGYRILRHNEFNSTRPVGQRMHLANMLSPRHSFSPYSHRVDPTQAVQMEDSTDPDTHASVVTAGTSGSESTTPEVNPSSTPHPPQTSTFRPWRDLGVNGSNMSTNTNTQPGFRPTSPLYNTSFATPQRAVQQGVAESSPLTPTHPLPSAPRVVPRTLSGAERIWTGYTPQSSRNNSLSANALFNPNLSRFGTWRSSVSDGERLPLELSSGVDRNSPAYRRRQRVLANEHASTHVNDAEVPWRGWTADSLTGRPPSLSRVDGAQHMLSHTGSALPSDQSRRSSESAGPLTSLRRRFAEDISDLASTRASPQLREEIRRRILVDHPRPTRSSSVPQEADSALISDALPHPRNSYNQETSAEREQSRPQLRTSTFGQLHEPQSGRLLGGQSIARSSERETMAQRMNRIMNTLGNQPLTRSENELDNETRPLGSTWQGRNPRATTPPRSLSLSRRQSPPPSPLEIERVITSFRRSMNSSSTAAHSGFSREPSPSPGRSNDLTFGSSRFRHLLQQNITAELDRDIGLTDERLRSFDDYLDYRYSASSSRGALGDRRRARSALGDYLPDEHFDSSYEGLLRLSSVIGEAKPRGLPAHLIDILPTALYKNCLAAKKEQRCPICIEDYGLDDTVLGVSECDHYFHKACFERWLQDSRSCPVCRRTIHPRRDSGEREDADYRSRPRREGTSRLGSLGGMFDLPGSYPWGSAG